MGQIDWGLDADPARSGRAVEVDWAGDAMVFADPVTGELTDAWLFVAALSFSAHTYVEAFADMKLGSWVEAHVHAFEAFGGTARLLVPDNLRTGVSRADRYEPALNPAYARMAEHYGTAIIPARIKRPRDKPVVEGSVRFVANQGAAVMRNRTFGGLAEEVALDCPLGPRSVPRNHQFMSPVMLDCHGVLGRWALLR